MQRKLRKTEWIHLKTTFDKVRKRSPDYYERIEELIDDHRRIFDAVVARDPDRADATLRKHFEIGNEYRRRAVVGESDSIAASR